MLRKNKLALSICLAFFIAYSILSVVRHNHFGSYGFDLGISDQVVWKYSQLKAPITTIQHYVFTSIFTDHIEFIYILLAPFYWIYNDPRTLLVLQAFFVVSSGFPMYLLARKKGIGFFLSIAILINYLMFYGIQNALWFDVHSLSFAAGFLAWFIYFLDRKNNLYSAVFFFLAIICKEDIAFLTGAIGLVYYLVRRRRADLLFMVLSGLYLFLIFYVYFPNFTQDGYRFQSKEGLLANMNLSYLYDTPDKRSVVFTSLAWFGFLPLLSPLYLIPAFLDLFHYFVLGHLVITAQDMFLHYRVTLAQLLVLPAIITISKYIRLNNRYVGVYLLVTALFFQYTLHLPLSYLTKSWFWNEPQGGRNINLILSELPANASLVSQNNITPHVAHRDNIFTLYPTTKDFVIDSPCGQKTCNWFRWAGVPEFLVVDTSSSWDERGFFVNRENFIDGLRNMEKKGVITVHKQRQDAIVYKVLKRP